MLLEQQAAAQEQHAKHEDMQAMLDRHQRENEHDEKADNSGRTDGYN